MPPGAAARYATNPTAGSGRVALRSIAVVFRVVPIGAPLVHVLAHLVEPIAVRSIITDALWTASPPRHVVRQQLRRFIPPGKEFAVQPAPRRPLPLRFRWQAKFSPRHSRQPRAIVGGVKPGNRNHWLPGMIEVRMAPCGRRLALRGCEKRRELGVGHDER